MFMKTGATVRLIQPEIKGEVKERRINAADETELLVEWTDASGEVVTRWFLETQLEVA
jgi:hypothetical protein